MNRVSARRGRMRWGFEALAPAGQELQRGHLMYADVGTRARVGDQLHLDALGVVVQPRLGHRS